MLALTKSGPLCTGSAADMARLRADFDQHHLIHLPGFLEPKLLQLIQATLARTPFQSRDQATGSELRPVDTTPYYSLELLLNSPHLFHIIEQITGCASLACFNGRIYRRLQSSEHHQRWHTDVAGDGRVVAVSINLSTGVYGGGVLRIRKVGSQQILSEAHNTGFGDALIFRVDPSLEHRITPVEGDVPKTAMAGWFKTQPEARSLFARGIRPSAIKLDGKTDGAQG